MLYLTLAQFLEKSVSLYVVDYRIHATKRMFERNVAENDVAKVLETGSIIEQYATDFPLPSVLINGKVSMGRPLHLVVGVNKPEARLVIITVYEPDPEKWADNYTRRR